MSFYPQTNRPMFAAWFSRPEVKIFLREVAFPALGRNIDD